MRGLTRKILKNQNGFTLVEMMVVVAITGILVVGFASYLYTQTKQQKAMEAKQNYGQLKAQVLNAASQDQNLSASENLQYQTLTSVGCTYPCYMGLHPPNPVPHCIFDCSTHAICIVAPPGCDEFP